MLQDWGARSGVIARDGNEKTAEEGVRRLRIRRKGDRKDSDLNQSKTGDSPS